MNHGNHQQLTQSQEICGLWRIHEFGVCASVLYGLAITVIEVDHGAGFDFRAFRGAFLEAAEFLRFFVNISISTRFALQRTEQVR